MTDITLASPDRLLRDVRGTIPGALDSVVRMNLFDTVRDFCQRSLAVKTDIDETLPAGVDNFVFAEQNGLEVIFVHSGRTSDGSQLIADPRSRDRRLAITTPRRFYCPEPNSIRFEGAPERSMVMTFVVSMCPTADAEVVPATLFSLYYEYIKRGVLGRLYGLPAKPYSNIAVASVMMRSYNAGVMMAKVAAAAENTGAGPPWQYPRWA